MKKFLLKCEKVLKPKLKFLKWLNTEAPLMFLILLWGFFFLLTIPFFILWCSGFIETEAFNVWLSILALLTTMILSIVVVL